jgi:NADH-quinone oxidoreductase subunit N
MLTTAHSQASLSVEIISAILPQLIIAFGITLALLLVAWRRSQRTIAVFTSAVMLIALVANISLLTIQPTMITQLLKVDSYSVFSFSLVLISALVSLHMSHQFLKAHIEVHDEYYLLLMLLVLGAGILVTSNHFASLFLGFELLSISLVGLVGYHRESHYSVESGFKYLVLSATASSFMLLGIAFIYSVTGNMSFDANVPNEIYHQQNLRLFFEMGILLFISGIAFKLSIAPFHFWTPDVYQGAPTPVTLLMATISKVAMFVVLVKCIVAQNYILYGNFQMLLMILAIASMLLGNILALKQQNLKRLIGYSSIAHMGYLLIVVIVLSGESLDFTWQSVLFYLSAYSVANLSIFMVMAAIQSQNSNNIGQVANYKEDLLLSDLRGLFWRTPSYALLIILAVLSLAGIPLTMGFIGKFYILSQATIAHAWWLIVTLIIGSGIALAYYLPIIFTLFEPENRAESTLNNRPIIEHVLVYSFIVIGLLLGIFPDVISQFIVANSM